MASCSVRASYQLTLMCNTDTCTHVCINTHVTTPWVCLLCRFPHGLEECAAELKVSCTSDWTKRDVDCHCVGCPRCGRCWCSEWRTPYRTRSRRRLRGGEGMQHPCIIQARCWQRWGAVQYSLGTDDERRTQRSLVGSVHWQRAPLRCRRISTCPCGWR